MTTRRSTNELGIAIPWEEIDRLEKLPRPTETEKLATMLSMLEYLEQGPAMFNDYPVDNFTRPGDAFKAYFDSPDGIALDRIEELGTIGLFYDGRGPNGECAWALNFLFETEDSEYAEGNDYHTNWCWLSDLGRQKLAELRAAR